MQKTELVSRSQFVKKGENAGVGGLFYKALLALLAIGIFQGVFSKVLTPLISERALFIFRLVPFNLYPTDLFVLPLALLVAGLAAGNMPKVPHAKRRDLIRIWWLICFVGIVVGVIHGNQYLTSDIKNLVLRSLFAPAFFYIGLRANLGRAFDKVINLTIIIAIVYLVSNWLGFLGVRIFSGLPSQGFNWTGFVLLLPYSILLARMLTGAENHARNIVKAAIIALSVISSFAKPNVAAWLICTVFAFLMCISVRRVGPKRRIGVVPIALLFSYGALWLLLLLYLTGALESVGALVQKTYLKQGPAVVADLSGGRIALYLHAYQKWRASPVLGEGLGSFLSGSIQDPITGLVYYKDYVATHNIAMQLLYQIGALGLFVTVLLVVTWLRRVRSVVLSAANIAPGGDQRGLAVFCLTILVASFYGESVLSASTGFLFWACMGLEAAMASKIQLECAPSSQKSGTDLQNTDGEVDE